MLNTELTLNSQTDVVNDLKVYLKELIIIQTESIREAITKLKNTIQAQNNRIEQLEARLNLL